PRPEGRPRRRRQRAAAARGRRRHQQLLRFRRGQRGARGSGRVVAVHVSVPVPDRTFDPAGTIPSRRGAMSAQPETSTTLAPEAPLHVAVVRKLRSADGTGLAPRDPLLRLAAFLDPGTMVTLTEPDRSGFLAAEGSVAGVRTVVFASDATVQGGAMGEAGCEVILTAYERALELGSPVVGLWHSGGARLPGGVVSLPAVGQ